MKIPRPCPYWVVSRCLALLLFIAAGLKLYGLRVEAVASMGFFAAPQIQLAVVILEIALGVWLLSGKAPDASWLVALFTFSAFAAVSLWLASIRRFVMVRFERMAAWFFSCLTVVLAGAAILVVPAKAFADDGSNCATECSGMGFTGLQFALCVGGCCNYDCPGDAGCDTACCGSACDGDPNCYATCVAFAAARSCTDGGCQNGFGGCTPLCNMVPCYDRGLNPATATCGPALRQCYCVP